MKISQAEWTEIRGRFLEAPPCRTAGLTLRDRVWAVTPGGQWVALPGTSDSPIPDRWWLGCDPEKLEARKPVGVVLLCKARAGSLYPIGLPASALHELRPHLSRNARQLFFSVMRRGTRFLLQMRGGHEVDVTERVGDLSWLASGAQASAVEEGHPTYSRAASAPFPTSPDVLATPRDAVPLRFFAVEKDGNLHPLDDTPLEAGQFYLVEARRADGVPGSRFSRRILARGGPGDLPADLAERHDHYAHGAGRR